RFSRDWSSDVCSSDLTLHGTDITLVGKDPSYEPVVTFSINESDGVTAVSQDLRKATFEHFDITTEIEVIPNFIDMDRFKRQKKRSEERRVGKECRSLQ